MAAATGRPTKYNQQMLNKANKYITDRVDVVVSAAGMAIYLGVNKDTLYEWAKHHPEFSDTLKRLNHVQERNALNEAYTGEANSNIAKLILANHGYSEKQQVDTVSSDGSMSPPTRIELIGIDANHDE